MHDVLTKIVARKKLENERRGAFEHIYDVALEQRKPKKRAAILDCLRRDHRPQVIAEIKHASPSAGVIAHRTQGSVIARAKAYSDGGVAAISVLADHAGFAGGPLDVRRVADSVDCPVLFKEFVLTRLQLKLARAVGADMVLLIVACLPDHELLHLVEEAAHLGLTPLVEISNEDELRRIDGLGAPLVGVNARDLHTFDVDPERAAAVLRGVDEATCRLWLSGMKSVADIDAADALGVDAVLAGETLMRANDSSAMIRSWRNVSRFTRPR